MSAEIPTLPATTSDIARVAGVSRATVSHVLNNHRGKFSAATEARVLRALDDLKYRPSMGGRALANGRSDVIVVVLARASIGPSVQEALDRVVDQAWTLGASVLTRFAGPDLPSTVDALLYVRPLAVMDLGGLDENERDELERAGIVVVPSRDVAATENPEHVVGAVQVELLATTKERIVIATLKDLGADSRSGRRRAKGVVEACSARGLSAPEIVPVELTREGALEALREPLTRGPIGVACYNDDVATAVLMAARTLGLAVPEEVAVVGVDVTPLGQLLDPPLSSIRVDISAAIDYNMQELRASLGRPAEYDVSHSLSDLVSLHPGGTA